MEKPNVFLIILDALRADRCFGKDKTSYTPNIDSLIKNGIKFDQVISSTDGTPASIASIFTACHPFKSSLRGGLFYYKLNKNITFLVDILKKNGYHAYATIPDIWFNKEFTPFFENGDSTYPMFQRLHNGLGDKIIRKLESINMKKPWFYYIHLEDSHKPISYPGKFDDEKYGLDEYDRAISHVDFWLGKFLEKIDIKNTLIILTSDHGDYVRSIKYGDKRISFEYRSMAKPVIKISSITPMFLYSLKTRILLGIRNIVTRIKLSKIKNLNLTAYEKRTLFSARSYPDRRLFDELYKVPLVFSGFSIKEEKSISQQVRSMDIFPTIMEMIGITLKHKIDGKSLVELIQGKNLEEEPVYIESCINTKNSSEGAVGIRTPHYKYFRKVNDFEKNIYLYNLQKDPFEENNIAYSNPDTVKEMEKYLQKIISSKDYKKSEKYEREELSEEDTKKVEEELRKLGYI